MSNLRRLFVVSGAAAMLVASSAARAIETFKFDIHGSLYHLFNAWECPGQICREPAITYPWHGTITLGTADSADGVYTVGNGLLSFLIDHSGSGGVRNGVEVFLGVPTLAVSLVGGHVSDISGSTERSPWEPRSRYSFAGFQVTYAEEHSHHYGPTWGTGRLVAAIPEPETYAMLLAGLALVGAATRRKRASPSTRLPSSRVSR
jgi:hypothetical protein